jgi:hypothetical protein
MAAFLQAAAGNTAAILPATVVEMNLRREVFICQVYQFEIYEIFRIIAIL